MSSKSVDQMTILQGDRAKLKDLLRNRLIECGWEDQVRLLCREYILKNGVTNAESIVQTVTPEARSMIPDVVKKELLYKITLILEEQETTPSSKKKDPSSVG